VAGTAPAAAASVPSSGSSSRSAAVGAQSTRIGWHFQRPRSPQSR